MKQFKINESVAKQATLEQIAVLAIIANAKTSKDNCYCYESYIADKLQYGLTQVKACIKSLKEINAFQISKERVKGEKTYRNIYTFKNLKNNFILVNDDVLTLPKEEIGFLIKAKAWSLSNGLTIHFSKDKLASCFGIGKSRLNKIIKSLSDKGFVKYETGKLTITCDYFIDNSPLEITKRNKKVRVDSMIDQLKDSIKTAENGKLVYMFNYYNQRDLLNENILSFINTGVSYKRKSVENKHFSI